MHERPSGILLDARRDLKQAETQRVELPGSGWGRVQSFRDGLAEPVCNHVKVETPGVGLEARAAEPIARQRAPEVFDPVLSLAPLAVEGIDLTGSRPKKVGEDVALV